MRLGQRNAGGVFLARAAVCACAFAMMLGGARVARAQAPAAQQAQPHAPSPAADQQARRDAAAELHRLGFDVDWRLLEKATD